MPPHPPAPLSGLSTSVSYFLAAAGMPPLGRGLHMPWLLPAPPGSSCHLSTNCPPPSWRVCRIRAPFRLCLRLLPQCIHSQFPSHRHHIQRLLLRRGVGGWGLFFLRLSHFLCWLVSQPCGVTTSICVSPPSSCDLSLIALSPSSAATYSAVASSHVSRQPNHMNLLKRSHVYQACRRPQLLHLRVPDAQYQ